MTVMLRKALWDIRWTATWFAAGGAGYVVLLGAFYPAFRNQSQTISQLVANYPKAMLTALGYTDMTTFAGFLGTEALNLFWPIIIAVFATLAGAALVAKEVEDGTSEMWLSVPAARWRLLLGKMGALAIALLAAVAACVAAVASMAAIVSASVTTTGLLAMGADMAAFIFVIAGYSALLSSILGSRGAAAGLSFGITLLFYVLWLVGGLADRWKQLKDISIFTAYTPQKALETGSVDVAGLVALVIITVACVGAALVIFQRRDAI